MKANVSIMLDLIKYCLFDKEKPLLSYGFSGEDIKCLYTFSKSHDISAIVGLPLKDAGLLSDDEYSRKFLSEIELSTYRYLQLSAAFTEISEVLEKEKIPFLPLKGTVLRKYYPDPSLRTSSDIDVLIRKEDIHRAVKTFTEGYGYKTVIIGDEHDVSLMTPSGVHLELHYKLIEKMPKAEKILDNVWNFAVKNKGSEYQYHLPSEYFLFYHIVHMARHFIYGGIGVKPVIDLYFIKNGMGVDLEKAYEILKKAELYTFTKEIEYLFDVWFSGAPHTEISKEIHRYIMLSGTYGTLNNAIVTSQIKNGGKFKTLLKRIFLPYNDLKTFYPILVKHPILYPFYQVKRWFRILLFSRKRVKTEVSQSIAVTDERTEKFSDMLRALNLKIENNK